MQQYSLLFSMTKTSLNINNSLSSVKIVNVFTLDELGMMKELYDLLPLTVNNKQQKNLKKQWLQNYNKELDLIYLKKIKEVIGDFKMDNLLDNKGKEIFGLFHESFKPLPLHADSGFDEKKIIYKQLLTPLSNFGGTVIFKNRWIGRSTTFTVDEEELKFIPSKGQNERSNKHIIEGKNFDKQIHKKYLSHIDINNLKGMELDLIYDWKIGETLIFDRSQIHSASSKIDEKKLGLTTFTIK